MPQLKEQLYRLADLTFRAQMKPTKENVSKIYNLLRKILESLEKGNLTLEE